jgi:hypothetical protein
VIRWTPRQDAITPIRPHLDDPNDEFTETALLLERVLSAHNGSIFYAGAGVTKRTGERWTGIEGGVPTVTREDIDDTGWTAEIGFRGPLDWVVGFSGAATYSAADTGDVFMVSLSILVGHIFN